MDEKLKTLKMFDVFERELQHRLNVVKNSAVKLVVKLANCMTNATLLRWKVSTSESNRSGKRYNSDSGFTKFYFTASGLHLVHTFIPHRV